ncbi:hypothetical protein PVK06_016587 [Gossypium arboreum]|uniref:Uncharacterized protein n=1 Tax=Gossypium arboreum TaxID=29729 RepID=A0ABR0Q0W5_GOSAR|nr:hypothetical protein PVK06_016587 [Gossypium arboreum]
MYTGDEEPYGLDEIESVTPSINPVRNQPPRVDKRNANIAPKMSSRKGKKKMDEDIEWTQEFRFVFL